MSNGTAQDQEQHPHLPGRWTLTRDILSFVGGWVLVFLEVRRPEVREAVLIFATSATTVPGAVAGATSLLDMFTRRRDGTGGQPSPPAAVQSSV